MQRNAQFVPTMLSLTLDTTIDLSSHGNISITGIDVTNDNKLLLCDYIGNKILLYNENGIFIRKRDVDNKRSPYQVKLMPNDTQAVITMPFNSGILIIDASSLLSINKRY